jgi:hypothetical protein
MEPSSRVHRAGRTRRLGAPGSPTTSPSPTASRDPRRLDLIVAESFASRRTAFDIMADGGLENLRVWAALRPQAGDRICLDA